MQAAKQNVPEILDHKSDGPMAWRFETMLPDDGLVRLDKACLGELLGIADDLRANPLPVEVLSPDDFAMPACRTLMAQVKRMLDTGIGFAIIEGMPLAELDTETAKALYWLVMSMLGRTVAQKWNGLMLYDVTDTGKTWKVGGGVRASKTNMAQGYHTDNAFNLAPDYVALFCLRPAKAGGVSGLISFETVHNLMLERHPDLLPRLYQPFYFDRQQEHAPGDDRVSYKPIFEYKDGALTANLNTKLARSGYKMMDKEMDRDGIDALAALDAILEEDGLGKSFDFDPVQIQIVNNRRLGHRRTGFEDWPEPERRRHLVRIWVRNQGRSFYHG